jgi:regulator of sigma E protease
MSQGVLVSRTVAQFNEENAPSYAAGLRVGDEILKLGNSKVNIGNDIILHMSRIGAQAVDVTVRRDGKVMVLRNVPFPTTSVPKEYVTGNPEDEGQKAEIIVPDFKVKGEKITFLASLRESYYKTISIAQLIWRTLSDLVTGRQPITVLSGPVGVVDAIGTAASEGFEQVISLIVLLTINLGFVNLLPIPALDGGKVVFVLFEALTRKRVNPRLENYFHMAGFAFVILLALVVTFNDVFRIFK